MSDPLSLLREYNIEKREIIERDEEIIFEGLSFPKNTETKFLKYGPGKNDVPPEYYTLECLVYFLKNVKLQHKDYVNKCTVEGRQAVSRPNRKELLAYLKGDTETCASINT